MFTLKVAWLYILIFTIYLSFNSWYLYKIIVQFSYLRDKIEFKMNKIIYIQMFVLKDKKFWNQSDIYNKKLNLSKKISNELFNVINNRA